MKTSDVTIHPPRGIQAKGSNQFSVVGYKDERLYDIRTHNIKWIQDPGLVLQTLYHGSGSVKPLEGIPVYQTLYVAGVAVIPSHIIITSVADLIVMPQTVGTWKVNLDDLRDVGHAITSQIDHTSPVNRISLPTPKDLYRFSMNERGYLAWMTAGFVVGDLNLATNSAERFPEFFSPNPFEVVRF